MRATRNRTLVVFVAASALLVVACTSPTEITLEAGSADPGTPPVGSSPAAESVERPAADPVSTSDDADDEGHNGTGTDDTLDAADIARDTPAAADEASDTRDHAADGGDLRSDDTTVDTSDASVTAPDVTPPTPRPTAPNGRIAPTVANDAATLAEQIATADILSRDATLDLRERADWGHLHQVAIRKLGYTPEWDSEVLAQLPADVAQRTELHVAARRFLIDLSSGYDAADFIPAWEIVEPASVDELRSFYEEAEAATGVEWEYLAGINLVETGMGRIRGLSSAGAQGPMQFIPTTWAESGIGAGDINDPRDAINAAARYLVRRGGPTDMRAALWGYNNSDNYVDAVSTYAEILRQDPTAHETIHHWEIYFYTLQGDVWLPTGFRTDETVDLDDFLAANPWSEPDRGLRSGSSTG